MSDEEENKQSKFNPGVALAERIDNLQKAINASRFNPLARNEEVGRYNYEIMISSLDGLFNEAWGKLKPDEKVLGERIQLLIKEFLKMNPIIVFNNNQLRINKKNYESFLDILNLYERTIKEFLEAHALSSPNIDTRLKGL